MDTNNCFWRNTPSLVYTLVYFRSSVLPPNTICGLCWPNGTLWTRRKIANRSYPCCSRNYDSIRDRSHGLFPPNTRDRKYFSLTAKVNLTAEMSLNFDEREKRPLRWPWRLWLFRQPARRRNIDSLRIFRNNNPTWLQGRLECKSPAGS